MECALRRWCCPGLRAFKMRRPRQFTLASFAQGVVQPVGALGAWAEPTGRKPPPSSMMLRCSRVYPDFRSWGARPPRALLVAPSRPASCGRVLAVNLWTTFGASGFSARARKTAPGAGALPFYFGIRVDSSPSTNAITRLIFQIGRPACVLVAGYLASSNNRIALSNRSKPQLTW